MNVLLKLTNEAFNNLKNGKINHLKHGYSCHRKFLRLLNLQKNNIIELKNEITNERFNRNFESIEVIKENNKKYYIISFV